MSVLLSGRPDRKIETIFAVICTDPETGLEGIAAFGGPGMKPMQAVSSKRSNAELALSIIRQEPWQTDFKFEIVEFVRKRE